MNPTFIITGAAGHLGSTIIRELQGQGITAIRALILPHERGDQDGVAYYRGDVRDRASLQPLFAGLEAAEARVIHAAGIVDISDQASEIMYDVNVNGTRNVVQMCREAAVRRLVYVSSVHAIPESSRYGVLREVDRFSADTVQGGYAKTKAEATQLVLDAARDGLDAVVVHPSGIIGPYEGAGNHLVQMVVDYVRGKLPACVRGGYDFVDVRDVAAGCVAAALRGARGECYILSNRHYEVKDLMRMLRAIVGGRRLPALPIWMVKMFLPVIGLHAKRKKKRPLFTRVSLMTLRSNDRFSHDKATRELGFSPRDLYQTLQDTVMWLKKGYVCAFGRFA